MDSPKYLLPLISSFKNSANPETALKMEKYMRNHFPFFGIKSPQRTDIYREFKKDSGLIPNTNKEEIVNWCWQASEREYQYFAMEFLRKSSKKESKDILYLYEHMIITKSWWDTVDFIASNLLGVYFTNYPDEINVTTKRWMNSGNIWLQRSCLLYQLKYKNRLNTKLLVSFIAQLNKSNEFFIKKAIGWILREYSKTNSDFVKNYVNTNSLSVLSKREALLWMEKKKNRTKLGKS